MQLLIKVGIRLMVHPGSTCVHGVWAWG